jgi:hypothetical protein
VGGCDGQDMDWEEGTEFGEKLSKIATWKTKQEIE